MPHIAIGSRGGEFEQHDDPFRPGPTAAPSQSTLDINAFRDTLADYNPQFFDVGQQLIDRGLGTATDPLVEAQRARGIGALQTDLTRRGVGGSVALNQIGRANLGFDEQALGQRNEALNTGFGLQSVGLQNAAAPAALSIGQLGAERAGGGGGGKGK